MKTAFCLLPVLFLTLVASPVVQTQTDFWRQTGGPSGGTVSCLATNQDLHIFAGTPVGVFRSTDAGATWAHVLTLLGDTVTHALAVKHDTIVFAGTHWGGVYRSTDGGDSWRQANTGIPIPTIYSIAIAPDGDIYAADYDVVYRSTDDGENWILLEELPAQISTLLVTSNGYLYAAGDGVYRSTDKGVEWVSVGFDGQSIRALCAGEDGAVLVAPSRGIYITRDSGETWIPLGLESNGFVSLLVAPNGTIFAGSGGVFRSVDGGTTWLYPVLREALVYSLTADSTGVIYAGADKNGGGGVFRSANNGQGWASKAPGIINTQVSSLAVGAGDFLYAGTYGGCVYTSSDRGATWTQRIAGFESYYIEALAVHPGGRVFAAGGGIYRSKNNGGTWERMSTIYGAYSIAISSTGNIFASTSGGVSRSTDEGEFWDLFSTGFVDKRILSVAVGTSGSLFAGSVNGDVYRSDDNGETWTQLSNLGDGVWSLYESAEGVILAGLGQDGLFRSTDGGASWTRVFYAGSFGGLIKAIAGDSQGNIYLSSNGTGVHFSSDSGETWHELISGLIDKRVYGLAVGTDGYLYCGTRGSGVFRGLPDPPRLNGVEPDSGSVNQSLSVHLRWSSSTAAESYRLEVSKDPDFQTIDYLFSDLPDTSFIITNLEFLTTYYWRVLGSNREWVGDYSSTYSFTTTAPPQAFRLAQNFPNPFNSSTTIEFDLPYDVVVVLEVHNLLGERVARLGGGWLPTGTHAVRWETENVSTGVYFYRLNAGDFSETRKMILVR